MHAKRTRNHQCRCIDELMGINEFVRKMMHYLMKHNRVAKAAWLRFA